MTTNQPAAMTFREMNLRVFQRKAIPHVLFQPRFEPWYDWHKQFDSLPAECRGRSLMEVYDDVGASMRYVDYYTGQPCPVIHQFDDAVKITHDVRPDHQTLVFHTPYGDLIRELELTVDRSWRQVGFPCKSHEDLPALQWLLEHQRIRFDPEAFRQGAAYIGEHGVPQCYLPKSPYLLLAQWWMRLEVFMYALHDAPRLVHEVMETIDRSYDTLYEQLTTLRITPIVNFGENIAEAHMSPTYFREYLLPWYHKRVGQLKEAGIYSHIHIDGYFKTLLPQLKDLPHDGLEALTPKPQGDVTLEQIAEHIGDKILLDGLPAVLFLRHHPREQLERCVERVIELFHPRLVLGISDELPQGGDDESFERLKWVAEYCKTAGMAQV